MRGHPTYSTLTTSDGDLLARYVTDGDEQAFAALVDRHAGLVFGAAMRRVENRSAAEDVAQAVFIVLAKKARRLARQTGRHQSGNVFYVVDEMRLNELREQFEPSATQPAD